MFRFLITTLLAITSAMALYLFLPGGARIWGMVCVGVVYLGVCGCGVAFIQMQFHCPAVCRGRTGRMRVALTFDDGPDPRSTPPLLDLLHRENIPATFFCLGKNVDAHPELAARIAADGHLLANHTYSHSWWLSFRFVPGLVREMARTQQAIRQAAGVTPMYMRPPLGLTNPHFARALRKVGLTMIAWDVRTFDTISSSRRVLRRIVRQTRDGSIILLHDGGVGPEKVVGIVSAAAAALRGRGLDFERLDRLIDGDSKDRSRRSDVRQSDQTTTERIVEI